MTKSAFFLSICAVMFLTTAGARASECSGPIEAYKQGYERAKSLHESRGSANGELTCQLLLDLLKHAAPLNEYEDFAAGVRAYAFEQPNVHRDAETKACKRLLKTE